MMDTSTFYNEIKAYVKEANLTWIVSWFTGFIAIIVASLIQVNDQFSIFRGEINETDSTYYSEITITGIPLQASYELQHQHQSFQVDFNPSMRIDETTKFTITFDKWISFLNLGNSSDYYSIDDSKDQYTHQLNEEFREIKEPIKFKLFSSGFDIEPSKEQMGKEHAPFTLYWTLTAKSEGNHKLILDLSDVIFKESSYGAGFYTEDFMINGKKYEIKNGAVEFDTIVYNIWNIKRQHFEILKYVMGLIGFILMYPLVSDFIKTRVRKKPKSDSSAGESTLSQPDVEKDTQKEPDGRINGEKKKNKTTQNKH